MKRIIAPLVGLAVLLATAATAAAAPAAHAAGVPTLKLTLTGKSITVSGSPVSGAVNVVSVTRAAQGSPTLVHLNPGVTFAQAFGAVGRHHGDPNYLSGLAQVDYNTGTRRAPARARRSCARATGSPWTRATTIPVSGPMSPSR